jgi:methionyl-tRNA synthetase
VADLHWGNLPHGQALGEITGVFPRADMNSTVEKMRVLEQEELARQAALLGKKEEPKTTDNKIAIDDFVKVDMRVGLVKSAEAVKGADKLLHLQVDIGEAQPRSIVAGIAGAYKPETLVGRKVVIVANLQPRKLRGLESQGMIVAASLDDSPPVLAAFLEDVPIGARLR